MRRFFLIFLSILFCFSNFAAAQIPIATMVQIVRAEDERRWDGTLENLLKNSNPEIRKRAALAAGRIGDEASVPALAALLKDSSIDVQAMAAFALGETESAKAAPGILDVLKNAGSADSLCARAIEAAGKIAAANAKDALTPELGKAIVAALTRELDKKPAPAYEVILLGETAVLRARPEGGEALMIKLLSQPNARIRLDALNALSRLQSKSSFEQARQLLQKDSDPLVRGNAVRILGTQGKDLPMEVLLEPAMIDIDSRVRVNAIRALAGLKNPLAADKLLVRAQALLAAYQISQKRFQNPPEKTELLEIATTLGRLLPNTNHREAVEFLTRFNNLDKYQSAEIEIALARITPAKFSEIQRSKSDSLKSDWRAISSMTQGIGELANAPDMEETKPVKEFAKAQAAAYIRSQLLVNTHEDKAISDALTAYAAFKPADLSEILRDSLAHQDPIVRATVAGILADQPASKENVEALKTAFTKSLLADKHENDAQLAILDALYKLDKKAGVGTFLIALDAPDYLVRKRAFQFLKDSDLQKDFPGIPTCLENAAAKKKNQLLPFAAYTGTKLGQILNTQADYARAVSRKNGTVKAVLLTTKGSFTIDLMPEDAPLTIDNFIRLARANYFNNVSVHRVVANFVMQDGDPRGDGNGGPGWEIRCEINMLPFDRGAVGMALSGKDTGGSQWFVTHSPQPHLEGGYTVFGKVNEIDMNIVDSIARGDKIISVKIVEAAARPNQKAVRSRGGK